MSQKIASLENKLQQSIEETERMRKEKQKADEIIKRYREKLKSLGVDPDDL